MQQGIPPIGWIALIGILIIAGFIAIKLLAIALRTLFQVLLLYGVVIVSTVYKFIFALIQGKGIFESAFEAGVGFGLIVPTGAYDSLIPDLDLIAILIIWLWLIVLVSTFYQTKSGLFAPVMELFGRWRAFGAFLFGTLIWWVFGFGLPNLSEWISGQVTFTWLPHYWLFTLVILGFVISVFEINSRIKLLDKVPFNLVSMVGDIKKAIMG